MTVTTGGRMTRIDVGVLALTGLLAAGGGDARLLAHGDVLDLPAELVGEDLGRVGVERGVDVHARHAEAEELHQELGGLEAHLLRHRRQRDVVLDADHLLVRAHLERGHGGLLGRTGGAVAPHHPPAAAHHRA
jgi:hypothetical protein